MSLGVPRAKCHIPSCAVSLWLDTSLVLSLSLVTAVCPVRLEGKKSVSELAGVSKVEDEIQGCSGTFPGRVLCQLQAVEGGVSCAASGPLCEQHRAPRWQVQVCKVLVDTVPAGEQRALKETGV